MGDLIPHLIIMPQYVDLGNGHQYYIKNKYDFDREDLTKILINSLIIHNQPDLQDLYELTEILPFISGLVYDVMFKGEIYDA